MKAWSLGSWNATLVGTKDSMLFDNCHFYLLYDERYGILGLKLIL